VEGILPFTGFVLAAVMAGVAFLCWRKAMSYHVLLVESSQRFDALRHKLRKFEKDYANNCSQLLEKKQQLDISIKSNQELSLSWDEKFTNLSTSYDRAREDLSQKELKLDHLTKQVEVMTSQLREADNIRRDLQEKISYAQKSESEASKEVKTKLQAELKELKRKNHQLEGTTKSTQAAFDRIKRQAEKVGIDQLQANKRKLGHYKHLYQSMRGLREMADERNLNWERALRMLSGWVLSKDPKNLDQTIPLGTVVGDALEHIGEGLITDEFSRSGATKSAATADQVESVN